MYSFLLVFGPVFNRIMVQVAFQLFYGKVYTYFSIKYTFILAISIFEVGSLVCALAPTSRALIVGRAVPLSPPSHDGIRAASNQEECHERQDIMLSVLPRLF